MCLRSRNTSEQNQVFRMVFYNKSGLIYLLRYAHNPWQFFDRSTNQQRDIPMEYGDL